ncbi:MAG: hypothetical protein Q4D90_11505, partial [bacterium]|nr:hypothetical protein [bacterium]
SHLVCLCHRPVPLNLTRLIDSASKNSSSKARLFKAGDPASKAAHCPLDGFLLAFRRRHKEVNIPEAVIQGKTDCFLQSFSCKKTASRDLKDGGQSL